MFLKPKTNNDYPLDSILGPAGEPGSPGYDGRDGERGMMK